MNKQEWFDCKDLNQLLEKASDRKRQLFALACCRSIEHLIKDQRSKNCLEKIELFIDGKIDKKEFEIARHAATKATSIGAWAAYSVHWAAHSVCVAAAKAADAATYSACASWSRMAARSADEQTKQIEFLKDIYNPFLIPLTFPQKAIQLAEEIYETNNPTTRLILSDFLEEHYFPEELYAHLKLPTHYKGCWVIDQILNKP